ncbi:MAG: hypothetical protein HY260_01005 [Chloroflexi bacterium]|nr:hypothetical protein [Chloroflexota bacterium]
MSAFGFVPLILLFPILGLLINLAFGYKLGEKWVGIFACGAAASAFGVAVGMLVTLLRVPEGGVALTQGREAA